MAFSEMLLHVLKCFDHVCIAVVMSEVLLLFAFVPLWWVAPPEYGRQRWRVRPLVAASSAGAPAVHPHYTHTVTHPGSIIRKNIHKYYDHISG